MDHASLTAVILSAIAKFNEGVAADQRVQETPGAILFGRGGKLDFRANSVAMQDVPARAINMESGLYETQADVDCGRCHPPDWLLALPIPVE